METDLGYADLNLPVARTSDAGLKSLVKRALELGYQTVALNTVVDQVFSTNSSCILQLTNSGLFRRT